MFKQPINQSSQIKAKSFNFSWDKDWFQKRHWILLIGLACLVFWYFAPSLKSTPWLQSTLNLLPLIGGIAFATETILKLSQ